MKPKTNPTNPTNPKPPPDGGADVCGVRMESLTDAELDDLLSAVILEQGRRLDLSAELEDGAELSADALAVELDLTADERGLLE